MTISTSIREKAEYLQAQKALSTWDNEGGACPDEAQKGTPELAEGAHKSRSLGRRLS